MRVVLTLATLRTSLAALRALAVCACLLPVGLAIPLHRAWHSLATHPAKPAYHHVVMTGLDHHMPWSLWFTCALFFALAFMLGRRACSGGAAPHRRPSAERLRLQHAVVRLNTCFVLVTLPVLLALRHMEPKTRFTTVQGYWTTFAGPHEYAPILLGAAAMILLCGSRASSGTARAPDAQLIRGSSAATGQPLH